MKKPVKKKMISEYGGKEKYTSKAQKMRHEKAEGKTMEKKEKKMMSIKKAVKKKM